MIEFDANPHQVVSQCLAGERAVDEKALASLEILRERLERVNHLPGFTGRVEFSEHVGKLTAGKNKVAVM